MKFSLIICTYKRPKALVRLLDSVQEQHLYPNEIIIVDGSPDNFSLEVLKAKDYPKLIYYKVNKENRGLTKQRNYGIAKVSKRTEVVCFLDDDTVLTPEYFKNLIDTYFKFPAAIGVGGYIIDDIIWRKLKHNEKPANTEYVFDGFARKDSSRFILRKKMGLIGDDFPTFMPGSAHGRSVGFLPPSGKIYRVETFMGGVSSFRKEVFEELTFSTYFRGYGLYEDTDFTLRCSKLGNLYLNTAAKLYHFHNEEGRPNKFHFGNMVVRNGWYVWKVKNPSPDFFSVFRWHIISWLLIIIRLSNIFTSRKRKEAFTESLGRIYGWATLFFNKPK